MPGIDTGTVHIFWLVKVFTIAICKAIILYVGIPGVFSDTLVFCWSSPELLVLRIPKLVNC